MLSQRGRYALKALVHLARVTDGLPRGVASIAAAENISRKFLEAILVDLKRHRVLRAVRGKYGGYMLARPAEKITFGEVIRITDGPLALVPCVSKLYYRRCDDCSDEATCAVRRVLADVREQVSSVLDTRTLAQAVAGDFDGDEMPAASAA